jgi:hypothetical protein
MGEQILKIQAEDLTRVRLVFGNGTVHEIPLARVDDYAVECHEGDLKRHLRDLADAIRFFSTNRTDPSIEFAVSVER